MPEAPATIRSVGVEMRTPILVVAPHLDDAVLSAGNLLQAAPGSSVVTIFAGSPASWDTLTEWDATCGFSLGDDVVSLRKKEDQAALDVLRATPVWLDFVDSPYAESERPDLQQITDAITEQVQAVSPQTVICPLGLTHNDHERVAAAASLARMGLPDVDWYAYGDLPYIYMQDGVQSIDRAVRQLNLMGVDPRSLPGSAASPAKRAAIDCYPSQKQGLGSDAKLAFRQEWYWRLASIPTP